MKYAAKVNKKCDNITFFSSLLKTRLIIYEKIDFIYRK